MRLCIRFLTAKATKMTKDEEIIFLRKTVVEYKEITDKMQRIIEAYETSIERLSKIPFHNERT